MTTGATGALTGSPTRRPSTSASRPSLVPDVDPIVRRSLQLLGAGLVLLLFGHMLNL